MTPSALFPRSRHLAALTVALLFSLALHAIFPAWFGALDARLADGFWRLGADGVPEQRVVVVDIDEASLKETGPWPWPRERLAALSDALAAEGAALQIFDVVLNESRSNDDALAATLLRNRAVIAEVFAVDQGAPVKSGQPGAGLSSPPCRPPLPEAHGYIAPAAAFAGLPVGHITPRVSRDGIVRAQPAYVCLEGRGHPALALGAYLGASTLDVPPQLQAGHDWLSPSWQLHAPGMVQPIPLSAQGDLHIPYTLAPEAILAVSAADVLAGRVPPGLLKGGWALVSSTAFGLGDVVSTPHAGAQGGASVHVQLLAGLLDARLPYAPQGESFLQTLAVLAAALILLFAARWPRLPGYVLPLAGMVLAAVMLSVQAYAQLRLQLLIGMSSPAFAVLLAGLTLGLVEFIRTGGERSRLLAHLASYLPQPVARRLLTHAPQDGISAGRRDVTVLFADIRNFSAWCEAYDAEQAARLLHQFLVTACEVAEAHGGLIEAVQGDAVMAVWNGSTPCDDHAAQALAAAQEMHARVEAAFLPPPPTTGSQPSPPPLALGIGLESGSALIGSFGPRKRRVHTALGPTVTRAARLQGMTADLSWPILAGPGLQARLPEAPLLPQGEFLLEGLTQPCVVYAVAPVA